MHLRCERDAKPITLLTLHYCTMPRVVFFLWCALLIAGSALAQLNEVTLTVTPQGVGIAGNLRPGTWAPMRIEVDNPATNNRVVFCRWLLEDTDGDTVIAQRRVTLNAQRKEPVWLYGNPPMTTTPNATWTVQVVDADSGRLLASQQVGAQTTINPRVSVIGLLGTADMGLSPYTEELTHHEKIALVRSNLTDLPDRWFGLSLFNSIVWTGEGGDPNDALVTADMQQAVRQWVRRGGHLVIVVPTINEPWTPSALADILPVTESQIRRVEDYPPRIVGNPRGLSEPVKIPMNVFDVTSADGIAVIARDRQSNPVIITGRHGFGAVTMVGVDLADRRIRSLGLPVVVGRGERLWNRVFDWQGPIDTAAVVQGELDANRRNRPDNRNPVNLTHFLPSTIAQTGTVAAALLAAILTFGLYWLLAGPVSYFVLRQKKQLRFSWLIFLAVVGAFTAVAWGGAWLMRPGDVSIAHFSVLDYDASTGNVNTHGWMSVYVPAFADVEVALDPNDPGNSNTLSSPGMIAGLEDTGFVDPQSYTIDCASPNAADIPFRATAKQFEIDYMGRLDRQQPGLASEWVLPQGTITLNEQFWPEGELSHDLPGALTNVLFVYCPGNTGDEVRSEAPWVWRLTDASGKKAAWAPQTVINVALSSARFRLVERARDNWEKRNWQAEGFLGNLIGLKTGVNMMNTSAEKVSVSNDVRVQAIEMLSFYETLPPPDFRNTSNPFPGPPSYKRELGRPFDLTALTSGRRLIIIGHLTQSPLPAPLTIDGETPESEGWTVVRWIYDLN